MTERTFPEGQFTPCTVNCKPRLRRLGARPALKGLSLKRETKLGRSQSQSPWMLFEVGEYSSAFIVSETSFFLWGPCGVSPASSNGNTQIAAGCATPRLRRDSRMAPPRAFEVIGSKSSRNRFFLGELNGFMGIAASVFFFFAGPPLGQDIVE